MAKKKLSSAQELFAKLKNLMRKNESKKRVLQNKNKKKFTNKDINDSARGEIFTAFNQYNPAADRAQAISASLDSAGLMSEAEFSEQEYNIFINGAAGTWPSWEIMKTWSPFNKEGWAPLKEEGISIFKPDRYKVAVDAEENAKIFLASKEESQQGYYQAKLAYANNKGNEGEPLAAITRTPDKRVKFIFVKQADTEVNTPSLAEMRTMIDAVAFSNLQQGKDKIYIDNFKTENQFAMALGLANLISATGMTPVLNNASKKNLQQVQPVPEFEQDFLQKFDAIVAKRLARRKENGPRS